MRDQREMLMEMLLQLCELPQLPLRLYTHFDCDRRRGCTFVWCTGGARGGGQARAAWKRPARISWVKTWTTISH